MFRGLRVSVLIIYVFAQVLGAIVGVVIANLMLGLPALSVSTHARSGANLLLGEVLATFGLLLVIFGITRTGRSAAAPFAVGAYITAAYFFTSSTSFANPAVTLARTLSDTFAGIAPSSVVPFVIAQIGGAALACVVMRMLWPRADDVGQDVVMPHVTTSDGAQEVECA